MSYKKIEHNTRRLVLRPYRTGDYAAWANAHRSCHPKQNNFDPGRPAEKNLTLAAFKKRLKQYSHRAHRDELYKFGIFDKKTGAHLGSLDLYIIIRKDLHWANLGYQIHNTHWGKGYATEAARAAIRLGFKVLKIHRIEAAMELNHKASQAVARRIGMKREGIRRRFFQSSTGWQDMVVFAAVK